MTDEERKNRETELREVFGNVSDDKKKLIEPLIKEVLYLEEQIAGVRDHKLYYEAIGDLMPTNTFKLHKELFNQYNLAIKTLATFLNKQDKGEKSELDKLIEENNEA